MKIQNRPPSLETAITYASRYPAMREFECGHSLIRAACSRFSHAHERNGIASLKREVYERASHYEFSAARCSVTLAPSATTSFFPLIEEGEGSWNGKGERKLIANATGTKLPNRLSPGRTGLLISRTGASTRRTLFLRGGPC